MTTSQTKMEHEAFIGGGVKQLSLLQFTSTSHLPGLVWLGAN